MQKGKSILIYVFIAALCTGGLMALAISGCGQGAPSGVKSGEKAMYRCPMHPTYTSDKPGDCPICGMKLVKFEKAAEAAEGTARKTAPHEAHKSHGVPEARVVPSEEKAIEEVCIEHDCTMKECPMYVKAALKPGEKVICPICGEYITTSSGKMASPVRGPMASNGMKVSGKPARPAGPTVMIPAEKQQLIGVKTEPVSKRKLEKVVRASGKIAYDPELVVTQEEFIQALINEENTKDSPLADVVARARALTGAARRKLKLMGMGDEQIAELEKTKKPQTSLYLPDEGESVWAYLAIYEYEIGLVKEGMPVEIEAVAYPGEVFHGTVKAIKPVLDPMTRTNEVRVLVDNPEGKLKPEMFVNSKIRADLGESLAIPQSAVLDTGLRKIVYLSREGDILESREVRLGRRAEGYYEVLGGLDEGDIVVTSGNFLIDSESRLQAPAAASGGEHKHGQ